VRWLAPGTGSRRSPPPTAAVIAINQDTGRPWTFDQTERRRQVGSPAGLFVEGSVRGRLVESVVPLFNWRETLQEASLPFPGEPYGQRFLI